jgi:putative hemin transport protein
MTTLYERWMQAREDGARARDVATEAGVSEAELVASAISPPAREDGPAPLTSVRLAFSPVALLPKLTSVGSVKTITRNEAAVLEIEGEYANVEFYEAHGMGQSLGSIDLRIFLRHWKKAFWVEEQTKRGPRQSLQFFDASGTAIHKVYATKHTDAAAFAALAEAHFAGDQSALEAIEAPAPKAAEKPDADVDVVGFRKAWSEMKDTHAFFGVMGRFGVTRTQALRLAGSEYAVELPVDCLGTMLAGAAAAEIPIMLFVGNPGLIQIHTGPVRKIVTMDDWWNVLDPETNLHVRRELVHSAWIVRKPTADGIVTSVELYDASGETVLYAFGKRKPGQTEQPAWRELAEALAA